MKPTLDTKEHLLYFILTGKIRLSSYDDKFFSNLVNIIHNDKQITTNQATLFDNLTVKYSKQLSKQNINPEEVTALQWKIAVVPTSTGFTNARISLNENSELILKVPFNKHFIAFTKHTRENPFEWDNTKKEYSAKFSTQALKFLYDHIPKYFSEITPCLMISKIVEDLEFYKGVTVWDPTLVKVGEQYYIAACNPIIGTLIQNKRLNLESKTLYELSKMAIKVDPQLISDDPAKMFAYSYKATVNLDDLHLLGKWLLDLGITAVYATKGTRADDLVSKEVEDSLRKVGIKVKPIPSFPDQAKSEPFIDNFPVIVTSTYSTRFMVNNTLAIPKVIQVQNTRAVQVK